MIMNNLRRFILMLLPVALIAISCTSKRDKEVSRISELEENLKQQAARPEAAKLDELLALYTGFVDTYPQDTAAAMYLYRAVNLSMGMGKGEVALKLIDRSINEYPQSPRYAETVFLKAYVYENLLGKLGSASEIYRDFIHRFPDHELADDAQAAIQNLGKTPEQLVEEFERNAAANAQ